MILYVCVWYTYDICIRRILARCFAVAWAKPNRSAVSLCGVTAPFGAGAGAERSTASGRWWLVVVRGWGWQDHLCKTGATELKSAWLHEWEMYRNVTCGYLWILCNIHEHSVTFPLHPGCAKRVFVGPIRSDICNRWSRLPGWLGSHQHRWRSLSEAQFQKFWHWINWIQQLMIIVRYCV